MPPSHPGHTLSANVHQLIETTLSVPSSGRLTETLQRPGPGAPMPGVGAGGWNTVGEAEIIRGHISLTSGTLGTGHKETLNKMYSSDPS